MDKNGGDSDGSANIGYNDGTYTSFTAATRAGYTCKGYYTATSAGTKVLNADGTRASSSVSGWWTSSKWSKDAAEATLYAQWEAASSCGVPTVGAPSNSSFNWTQLVLALLVSWSYAGYHVSHSHLYILCIYPVILEYVT